MKTQAWLIIDKNGVKSVRKSRPALKWDELSICLDLEVPKELFARPTISARLEIKDIPNSSYSPELIINTAELIEQQTGAKINFTVVHETEPSAEQS